jgi:hypothetical protein
VVNVKYVVIAVLIALVAGVCAVRFWPSDERAIRRQLALIESAGSKAAAEKPVEALLKARQIAELFGDPCLLTVESVQHAGSYARKQIQDRVVMVRAAYLQASVSLHDVAIDIDAEKTAVVRGTVRLRGQQATEAAVADAHELRAEMRPIDGKWLFTAVEIVQVLER